MHSLEAKWFRSMGDIDRDAWDALAKQWGNPVLLWSFLNLLESSGSICPETGWIPLHFTLWKGDSLEAAAPLYIKTASEGEFVFDWVWAEAAEKLRRPYYPKLVGMIPATPAVVYRLLSRLDADIPRLTERFVREAETFCKRSGLTSLAFHFCDPLWAAFLPRDRFFPWKHTDFMMHPSWFFSWEDYLRGFSKTRRRSIKREYESVKAQGLTLAMIPGRIAPVSLYPLMWEYYCATTDRYGPWAARFMNRGFFLKLREALPDNHLFCAAYEQEGEAPVALALFLCDERNLLGRYWGARRFYPDLHFSVCYYEPIRWAIEHKIENFDPGMGGDHKVRRGFTVRMHESFHRFFDPVMETVFVGNIEKVNAYEEAAASALRGDLA